LAIMGINAVPDLPKMSMAAAVLAAGSLILDSPLAIFCICCSGERPASSAADSPNAASAFAADSEPFAASTTACCILRTPFSTSSMLDPVMLAA
jgi:hypothetical protein